MPTNSTEGQRDGAVEMSRRRVLTDEQSSDLATWFRQLRLLGSVQSKCRELGISRTALYDAIARAEDRLTSGGRHKLTHAELEELCDLVSHETLQTDKLDTGDR